MQRIKRRMYQILSKPEEGDKVSHFFDVTIISLIILCVVAIVLESFDSFATRFATTFRAFEVFAVVVFTIEYLLRIWTADLLYPEAKYPRLKYLVSFLALIDLLAILPFYLPFLPVDLRFLRMLRFFRLARLLRLFKLSRYVDSLQVITEVLRSSAAQLLSSLAARLLVMVFSAILMYFVENPVQPEQFPNVMASLWWAVCTLTTVGYGDVYPITGFGRFMASIISIMGIGIVAVPTGILSAGFMGIMNKRRNAALELQDPKRFCPYCGHKLEE